MREAGLDPVFDAESIAVVGFLEVARHLPRLRRAYRACLRVLDGGVDAVLLVDYPGFNLRLAATARGRGVPVLYFISPQVWAWRPRRVERIARDVDRMLVVFPFEEKLYREKGVSVEYVGHPLLDLPDPAPPSEVSGRIGLKAGGQVLGVLPGSRESEVKRNLPPALGAARLLKRSFPQLRVVVPVAPTVKRATVEELIASFRDVGAILSGEPSRNLLPLCRAAIVASGTATLEAALLEIPMVVVYRLNRVTAALARRLTVTDTFGLVNIVAGKRIVPECIQERCTPEAIARKVERYLSDPRLHAGTVQALREVRAKLGSPGAYERAARSLLQFLASRGEDSLTPPAAVSTFRGSSRKEP